MSALDTTESLPSQVSLSFLLGLPIRPWPLPEATSGQMFSTFLNHFFVRWAMGLGDISTLLFCISFGRLHTNHDASLDHFGINGTCTLNLFTHKRWNPKFLHTVLYKLDYIYTCYIIIYNEYNM